MLYFNRNSIIVIEIHIQVENLLSMYLNCYCSMVRCIKKILTRMVVDMDHKCILCANITCNIAQSYTLSDI